MGILIRMMKRAMYRELSWNTGVRMRVLKYMTKECQRTPTNEGVSPTRGDAAELLSELGDDDNDYCIHPISSYAFH